ncbi:DUF1015 family protein [Streptomyces sp. NPDC020472]|uniref:DUF1015 family protein n=1 Tax=Streptomyces sp. NPDC020472 TaxID=3365075 RepID=UPI0037B9F814
MRTDAQSTAAPLRPFRALRYGPAAGGPPRGLLSPPGDGVTADRAAGLAAHPHAFLRLVRPDLLEGQGPGEGPDGTARLLRAWTARGVLRQDARPSLYVVEQCAGPGGARVQRGLIGVLDLAHPGSAEVRPHEEVDPHRVRAQARRRRAAGADLEPVLLCFDGSDADPAAAPSVEAGAACLDRVAAGRPLVETRVEGCRVRLWRVDDPVRLGVLDAYLAGRSLCIADGHHRRAAAEEQYRTDPTGPGRTLLAMVVDVGRHPLTSSAIHRVLTGVPAAELLAAAGEPSPLRSRPEHAVDVRGLLPDRLHDPLAAYRLAERLIARVRPDGRGVEFETRRDRAVARAAATSGTALILPPVAFPAVRERAARGLLMPRKTTSLTPKPWSGLVVHRHHPGSTSHHPEEQVCDWRESESTTTAPSATRPS